MNRIHSVFPIILGPLLFAATGAAEVERMERPNIVIVFTDDQGYGDLGCYGSETIRTPRLDTLARDGTRFTDFYAQIVCGPSRSALLTGRYPVRSRGWSMPAGEVTVAELLQGAGYATACIGKWDVSNRRAILERMPNAQGFDYYWGTLGANDNGRVVFHENNRQVGQTRDMASLTRIYTDKGIAFLKANKDKPFFLYLAHTMVHSVIDASAEFKGKSKGGLYADAVEELDYHTGRLLDTIDELGLRNNTIVIFTTDNGPWNNMQENLRKKHKGAIAWGSSGPLREGKGSTYEGGSRVPCIVRWPGRVPAGRVCGAIFSTLDFMPTFATLAGYKVPADRIIDGVDQTSLLLGKNERGAREDYYYFCQGELHGVRKGRWKLLLPGRKKFYGYVKDRGSQGVELYDLEADVGEKKNLAEERPALVEELLKHARALPLPGEPYDPRISPAPPRPLPHIDVFVSGIGGYHTYRIPAIVVTRKGTLLAFCEGRKSGRGDAGNIDMLVTRSTDGGKTWSKPQVVWDDGDNTCGNPAPVVDQDTGVIWLPMTWNLGSDREGEIMAGRSTDVRHVYVTSSRDDGLTWAEPKKISETARKPHWRWYATGPGNAIQLTRGPHKGRLLIPANHSDHSDANKHPYRSHVFWSDDHGETWQLGGVHEDRTNESAVVELTDGSILQAMRSYHGKNKRAMSVSRDGGKTWGKVYLDDALQTPVCQASILRYSWPEDKALGGKSRILFSSPRGSGRSNLTVWLSYDEGKTWPVRKQIHAGGSAYSNLVALPDGRIGVLYEKDGYRTISLATFDLSWLEGE